MEELPLQIVPVEPVVPQQPLMLRRVRGGVPGVGREQVVNESQVVGEPLVGIEIDAQVQSCADVALVHHVAEILLQLGARENVHHLFGELLEAGCLAMAQVPASQLVVPGEARELLDRAAVDLVDPGVELVLVDECGQARVEAGVVGIAVQLAAEHSQRVEWTMQRDQARHAALEHAGVVGRARRAGLRRFPACRPAPRRSGLGRSLFVRREGFRTLGFVRRRLHGGPRCVRAQRDAAGALRQFFEKRIVGGELAALVLGARIGVGHT